MEGKYLYFTEIYKDQIGEFRTQIRALNSNIVFVSSEGYKNQKDCEDVWNHFVEAIRNSRVLFINVKE